MKFLNGSILFDIILLAGFVLFCATAFTMGSEAAVAPLFLTIPGVVLMTIQLIINLLKTKEKTVPVDSTTLKKVIFIYLWLIGLLLSLQLIGFTLSVPLFVLTLSRFFFRENWRVSLTMTLVISIPVHLFFIELLQIYFPPGVFDNALRSVFEALNT